MRESLNEIEIRGRSEEVIRLAFDLPRWPEFLPHYRWVKVLERDGERQTVEMACRRSGIPLKWRSHLWVKPAEGRMRFLHIAGPARGMDVEWTVEQRGDVVHVAIHHDLSLHVPLVRTAIGRWIVGEVFVSAVAGRTLRCLKEAVETGVATRDG
jgi:ribosome-associated toxin RatA of RatAB toxin-antitoxin module